MKVAAHCMVWVLAFCAVLVSPVVLIFAVPFAIGVGSDIVAAGYAPIATVAVAGSAACLMLRRPPLRASAKALCRSAAPFGAARRLAHAVASRHAAKSIS
jgi:hypothetical protein